MDCYAILDLAPGADPRDIKAAYHRALLAAHPDKNNASTHDIAAIKDAYRVLSNPTLRAKAHQDYLKRPRPAQLISLAEFDEADEDAWTHACRCGGKYSITAAEMDRGVHLVACSSCSEVVWVGYELAEEEPEGR
ncbi:DnaJ domain-containing protein [Mycena sanguinolenta]|nr:DnaJ domain-containing protein [Mycena sanguinolenta]